MSRLPITGALQRDARAPDALPRIASSALLGWRASDGLLLPLQDGIAATYRQRTIAATIVAHDGTSGLLAAAAPAFTAIDWDGDGVLESEALLCSPENAVRWHAPTGAGLLLPVASLTLRHEWIELGAAASGGPLWSLSDDAIAGGALVLEGTGANGLQFRVTNGSTTAVAALTLPEAIASGDRIAARATLVITGTDARVQLALVRVRPGVLAPAAVGDVGWTQAPETISALSAAIAAPAAWGTSGGVRARLNERGAASRGVQAVHASFLYPGVRARHTFSL